MIVGFILGLVTLTLALSSTNSAFAGAFFTFCFAESLALPIFILVSFLLGGLTLYFGSTNTFILLHFISWIITGGLYFFVFSKIGNMQAGILKQFLVGIVIILILLMVLIFLFGSYMTIYTLSK